MFSAMFASRSGTAPYIVDPSQVAAAPSFLFSLCVAVRDKSLPETLKVKTALETGANSPARGAQDAGRCVARRWPGHSVGGLVHAWHRFGNFARARSARATLGQVQVMGIRVTSEWRLVRLSPIAGYVLQQKGL